jgi:hypothetical protein
LVHIGDVGCRMGTCGGVGGAQGYRDMSDGPGRGRRSGRRARVAENSVVEASREVPDEAIVKGNRARVVRQVSRADRDAWTLGNEYCLELAGKCLSLGTRRIA